jgi:hypothetical protein
MIVDSAEKAVPDLRGNKIRVTSFYHLGRWQGATVLDAGEREGTPWVFDTGRTGDLGDQLRRLLPFFVSIARS